MPLSSHLVAKHPSTFRITTASLPSLPAAKTSPDDGGKRNENTAEDEDMN